MGYPCKAAPKKRGFSIANFFETLFVRVCFVKTGFVKTGLVKRGLDEKGFDSIRINVSDLAIKCLGIEGIIVGDLDFSLKGITINDLILDKDSIKDAEFVFHRLNVALEKEFLLKVAEEVGELSKQGVSEIEMDFDGNSLTLSGNFKKGVNFNFLPRNT